MSQYKVLIKNKDNTTQWEMPFQSGMIEETHNSIDTATLYVDYPSLKRYLAKQNITPQELFEGGFMNVYIYRDNVLKFGGFIADVGYQKYEKDFNVVLGIKSWLAYFENIYYTGTFNNTDQGLIAWDAISASNDVGLTLGSISPTKTRGEKTYDHDDVAKIVLNWTSDKTEEGYEIDVSPSKVITIAGQIGTERIKLRLEDGFNIVEYSLQVGLVGKVFNKGYIRGGKNGDDQIIRTFETESSYVDAWHTQEDLIQETNVEDTGILDDRIIKHIEQRKNPVRILSLKLTANNPSVTEYSKGDWVKVILPDVGINEMKRIHKKSIYFGDGETVSLEFKT